MKFAAGVQAVAQLTKSEGYSRKYQPLPLPDPGRLDKIGNAGSFR